MLSFAANYEYLCTQHLVTIMQLLAQIYITITIISFLVCFINAVFDYFQNLVYFKNHSLQLCSQVIKIILYIIGFLF